MKFGTKMGEAKNRARKYKRNHIKNPYSGHHSPTCYTVPNRQYFVAGKTKSIASHNQNDGDAFETARSTSSH
jgi:hypothetical protein